ncbi:MAG TPA: hypothetical protein VLT84_05995, partial [Acidobacteriota bacterium]|nr:hypothetical protein [Acidobacteriota bacterium]
RWRFIVERVKERKLLLGTCLEEGFFLGIASGLVQIALTPEHSFHKAMLEMKENRDMIHQELERGFGRKLALQCSVREAGPELEAHRARMDRAARDALAADAAAGAGAAAVGAEESLVRKLVDLFDGEVVEPRRAREGERSE